MALFTLILLEFGDFPMMRRMLRGITERSERMARRRLEPASERSSEEH